MKHFYQLTVIAVVTFIMGTAVASDSAQRAEQRIEALQAKWVEAVAQADVDAIVDLYADEAWFLPAGSPPLQGREEIRGWWQKTLADPPWQKLTFGPTEITLSSDGTLAWDVGSSRTTVQTDAGTQTRPGKYLIVWKKVDGEWKVVADAFNSN